MSFENYGADGTNTDYTAIAAGSDAKGSWVEIASSTGIDAKYLLFKVKAQGASITPSVVFDVGTGDPASVLIPDIAYEEQDISSNYPIAFYVFNVDIASGTRIAVRAEADESGGAMNPEVAITISDNWMEALSSITYTTAGITTGSAGSKMTQIDPGGSADTKGGWTEITASAPSNCEHLYVYFGDDQNAGNSDARWLVDIGTGVTEVVQIGDLMLASDNIPSQIHPQMYGPFPAADFQSARVSARAQCTITDATDRLFRIGLLFTNGTVPTGADIFFGSITTTQHGKPRMVPSGMSPRVN